LRTTDTTKRAETCSRYAEYGTKATDGNNVAAFLSDDAAGLGRRVAELGKVVPIKVLRRALQKGKEKLNQLITLLSEFGFWTVAAAVVIYVLLRSEIRVKYPR